MNNCKVAFVGAGNVATHLARGLKAAGFDVAYVASKGGESARILADELNAKVLTSLSDIPVDTDLVIIASKDAAVVDISQQLPKIQGVSCLYLYSLPTTT